MFTAQESQVLCFRCRKVMKIGGGGGGEGGHDYI